MANFDDLIPKSTEENPFANPFADIGRPRSPDPWSLGAFVYEQPHEPFDAPYEQTVNSDDIARNDLALHHDVVEQSSHDELHRKGLGAMDVDPLLEVHEEEQPTVSAQPFGPLPAVRAPSPPLQVPPLDQPADRAVPSIRPDPLPTHKIETAPGALDTSIILEAPKQIDVSMDANANQTVTQEPLPSLEHHVPPADVNPVPPHSDTINATAPSSSEIFSVPSESKTDPNSLFDGPLHQERIVSPLTASNTGSVVQSFNGLALGGEAPGWSPASLSPSATSVSKGYRTVPFTSEGAEDDEDDDRPLGAPRQRFGETNMPPMDSVEDFTQVSADFAWAHLN